jgi:prepilin-type N-terminal cleavage/methylation domain-containing protein
MKLNQSSALFRRRISIGARVCDPQQDGACELGGITQTRPDFSAMAAGHRPALRTPHSRAFTLIEIMMVVAIMIIALAFSYPAISDMVHRAPMGQAVKDITDACRHARSQAIITDHPMELRIYPKEHRIEVGQASTESSYGSGPVMNTGSPPSSGYYHPKNPYISSAQISDEVRLEMVDVNFTEYKDADVALVKFYPNGTCDELTLMLQSGIELRKISLEAVTSLAQVEIVQ